MNKTLRFILSIPKILWFNYRYLPFSQAKHIPFFISYDTRISIRRGGQILIDSKKVHLGMIHIGFFDEPVCNPNDKTTLYVEGTLKFNGKAFFGIGSKIKVKKDGYLTFGDGANITGNTAINCYHQIEIGQRCRMSWDILIMDSDTHPIYGKNGVLMNHDRPIIIEKDVWIGCRTMVLKGSHIPSNSIIAAGSSITGQKFDKNSIIAGHPPKSIKEIGYW